MNTHRYILEPYKGMNSRYQCPSCQKKEKTFTRYIDTQTEKFIAPNVGRCNRESNCKYHYTPKQYFQDNNISIDTPALKPNQKTNIVIPKKPISFIPVELFKASLKNHKSNHFIKFLIDLFGNEVTIGLINRYFIATSKYWQGATVFWQMDITGKVRTGKIMLYNPNTGKRVKEPFNHINWVHTVLKLPEFELKQCLFAEHLLHDKTKPVAIVESEKTAIIASVYFPQFIWLAVGSINNLKAEICNVLEGRKVTLFPDLNGFEKWSEKAKELSYLANVNISSLLERKACEKERKQGFDLADYLIQFNYRDFSAPKPIKQTYTVHPLVKDIKIEPSEPGYFFKKPLKPKSEIWNQNITELEEFFSSITLPEGPIKLNQCSQISNVSLFIEAHLSVLKEQNGNLIYKPDLDRLNELKLILREK